MRSWRATGRLLFVLALAAGAQERSHTPAERPSQPVRKATLLLREGKTEEAREELLRLVKSGNRDAETYYQLARTHLTDFHQLHDPAKRRISLGLAMESLENTLRQNSGHVFALKAKSVIHARAELLFYDPNLAYRLAARVVELQPYASEYLMELTGWMSGEVRFTEESEHRVPHDPRLGLDRSIDLLERVIDGAMPYSSEEAGALFLMAKALSKRGNFAESLNYYRQALKRPMTSGQMTEVKREFGASLYRMGNFNDSAQQFYESLQENNNPVDQFLLQMALQQLGPAAPKLPERFLFPLAEVKADPSLLLGFEDIAPRLGVNRFDGNGTCAWADYDGDGDPDLFLAGSGTFMAVFRNEAGKFQDVTAEVGLAKVPSGYSLNTIDYDNDGRLDLYISMNGWNGPMKNRLFRNTGGRFEDVSSKSGADDAGSGFVSLWGDLDNDGFPDLVIANGVLKDGSVPRLYRNNGNGTFTDVTQKAGIVEPHTHGTIGIALGDYDRDGDLDILMNGLNTSPNRLYRNEGNWNFTDVTRTAGLVQPAHNGFVCFFLDYNNDGWPDVLTTSLAPWEAVVEGMRARFAPASKHAVHPDAVRLFKNNGNGTFADVTWEAKLYQPMGVMGAGVADIDNDGCVDLYFGTGDPQLSRLEANRLFRNNCDGTFSDVTQLAGFARPGNKGHGVTFVDIDEDGDLDIYAQLGGHYEGDHAYNAFYRNLKGNRNRWLQIDLHGEKSNRFGVGTQLTLKAGELAVFREVKGSEGFGATDPYRVHFGIGKHEKIDRLEIRWPSGVEQVFQDLEPNRIIAVRENGSAIRYLK